MARTVKNAATGSALSPKLALLATAAVASVGLTGCTTSSAERAEVSLNKAQVALEKGKYDKAIELAEAAVRAEPRNADSRALLGAAYMEAGRFQSAATSFGDALELGSEDPRTVLSYALAKTAIGDKSAALIALSEWEGSLDPVDAGLAMALAGNPERAIFLITNALRQGQNSAKVRQNLAYTYALAGNWRAARVMAAEDVPADKLDQRLSEWAASARPDDYQRRVAELLQITPVSDPGLPGSLALGNFASQEQMVAEAAAQAPKVAKASGPGAPTQTEALTFSRGSDSDLEVTDPTVAKIMAATGQGTQTAPRAPKTAPSPKATPRPAALAASNGGTRFISKPVVQTVQESKQPTRVASSRSPVRPAVAANSAAPKSAGSADTHLVQLGSFTSRADANAGWETLKRKFPSLAQHDVIITKAKVKGRIYYRVAAAGFGQSSARSMCSTVKSAGRGCFAYAAANPPAGAIENGVRIAAR